MIDVSEVINFFVYDSIKIMLLLAVIVFVISLVRTYIPPSKIKKLLHGKSAIKGNIVASLIGIVTPFCSCSAVPLFIGMLESGVPLGVTFSYLISAPMINEVALAMLFAMFGFKIALIYVLSGLIIAIFAGFIMGKMNLQKYIERKTVGNVCERKFKTTKERINFAFTRSAHIVKSVFVYILIGVGLGAFIHGYLPADFLTGIADKWFAVPIAVLIGVPLYSNAAGTLPVVSSLIGKGLPLGTALAFMMSVTALSLPEAILLKKVMKTKLLLIYFSVVALGILIMGYLFNFIL